MRLWLLLFTVEEDTRLSDDIGDDDEMVQELLLVYINARNNMNALITLYLNSNLPEFEGAACPNKCNAHLKFVICISYLMQNN